MAKHVLTVIDEGNGYSPICSCGWRDGATYDEQLSARLAWAINHPAMSEQTSGTVVLAIVGSTLFAIDGASAEIAKEKIADAVKRYEPAVIISGGAPGIDTMAEDCARSLGIPFRSYLPKNPRWEPEGYKERNRMMAHDCTHLVQIAHAESRTYGSGWTADRAEEYGRHVERIVIDPVQSARP